MSSKGYRYYITFLDACTRYTWICLLKSKAEVNPSFLLFKTQVELQYSTKIKVLQTDCGKEFEALKSDLQASDILFRHSCPYTHEQNGLIERKHRHVVETGLSLLAQASMPTCYWDEAFLSAVFLINRMPTAVIDNKAPFEVLNNHAIDYSLLKVFGCQCYPHIRPYNKNKLQYRSLPCVFLGYDVHFKGYKCLAASGRIYMVRNVIFNEKVFPFKSDPKFGMVTPSSQQNFF